MLQLQKEYKTTEAQRRRTKKYDTEKAQSYTLRFPKGKKDELSNYIRLCREKDFGNPMYKNLNSFAIAAIEVISGLHITGVYQKAQESKFEREVKSLWLNTEISKLPKERTILMKNDVEFNDFVLAKLDKQWEKVKDEVMSNYMREKEG